MWILGHYFGQKLFFRLKCLIKTFLILNQNCTCGKERQTLNATIYITSPRPGRELMTAPKELVNTTGFINHSFALKKIDSVFFKTARKFIHIFILQKNHTSVWIAINRCMVLIIYKLTASVWLVNSSIRIFNTRTIAK